MQDTMTPDEVVLKIEVMRKGLESLRALRRSVERWAETRVNHAPRYAILDAERDLLQRLRES